MKKRVQTKGATRRSRSKSNANFATRLAVVTLAAADRGCIDKEKLIDEMTRLANRGKITISPLVIFRTDPEDPVCNEGLWLGEDETLYIIGSEVFPNGNETVTELGELMVSGAHVVSIKDACAWFAKNAAIASSYDSDGIHILAEMAATELAKIK